LIHGERRVFYNPEELLKRGVYFCTLKNKDGENDKASGLNRPSVFRLNFGVSKKTFEHLFGVLPQRPSKGGIVAGAHVFTELETLTPHLVYGWMAWVSILNPSEKSWKNIEPLLGESYRLALQKYAKRV